MKYIIAGGRDFNNYDVLTKILNIFINPKKDIIFSGGARGADELGARYAAENSIPLQIFPAYWDKYGKSAGFIRNAEMGEYGDALIAFWDGKSHGTKHMIQTMKFQNKPYDIFDYEGNKIMEGGNLIK